MLVIGGYDNSRVAGAFTSFPVSKNTKTVPGPLQVSISGLSFCGTSLLDDGQILSAMIEPFSPKFLFTPTIAQKFGNITGQNPAMYKSGLQYSADSVPQGDLVITLTNGYTTTITNNELFTLVRGSDQYGSYIITNDTVVEAGIADNRAKVSKGTTATLGGIFLTFNYLLVDYLQGNFSLAQAVPSSQSPSRDIRTICTPSSVVSTNSTSSSSPASTSASSTAMVADKSNTAVVGGAVGGVLGGLAIIGGIIAFVLLRRRQRRRQAKEARDIQLQGLVAQPPQYWQDEKADGQANSHREMSELGDGSIYHSGKSAMSASVWHGSETNSAFSPTHSKQDTIELHAENIVHELPGQYNSAELPVPQ